MTWGPFSRISPSSPGAGPRAVEADHDELDPRGGPALGVGQLLVGVVGGGHDHDGRLGEPVAGDDAHPADLALQVVVELGRLGRPTARVGADVREDGSSGPAARWAAR